jgi:hypothetical protein
MQTTGNEHQMFWICSIPDHTFWTIRLLQFELSKKTTSRARSTLQLSICLTSKCGEYVAAKIEYHSLHSTTCSSRGALPFGRIIVYLKHELSPNGWIVASKSKVVSESKIARSNYLIFPSHESSSFPKVNAQSHRSKIDPSAFFQTTWHVYVPRIHCRTHQ